MCIFSEFPGAVDTLDQGPQFLNCWSHSNSYLPDQKTGLAKLIELPMLTHQVSGCIETRKTLVFQMLSSEPFPGHHRPPLWILVAWDSTKKSKWIHFNPPCHADEDKRKASVYAFVKRNISSQQKRAQIPGFVLFCVSICGLHLSHVCMTGNWGWTGAVTARLIGSARLPSQRRLKEGSTAYFY